MRKKTLPEMPRYQLVKQTAEKFLIEMHITSLPFDCLDILDQMNIPHFPKSFFVGNSYGVAVPFEDGKRDAMSVYSRADDCLLCIYNDDVPGKSRLYWTLMHEIAHIYLGHLTEFEDTSLNSTNDETRFKPLETEADYFTALTLLPDEVLFEILTLSSTDRIKINPEFLKKNFKLSKTAADIRYESFIRNFEKIKDNKDSVNSRLIFRNFFDYIAKKSGELFAKSFNIINDDRTKSLEILDSDLINKSVPFVNDDGTENFEVTPDADFDNLEYEFRSFLLFELSKRSDEISLKLYNSLLYSRITVDDNGCLCIICDNFSATKFLKSNIILLSEIFHEIDGINYKKIYISYVDFSRYMVYNYV